MLGSTLKKILKQNRSESGKQRLERPNGRHGFSLVEVLIASAILSIAGVAYLQLSGTVNKSVTDVQEATMADNIILTLINEVIADSHLYPSLPTSIYDEREMSSTQQVSGVDKDNKLSPDRFLQNFMLDPCNRRFMAYRCYNFMGAIEFSCEVKYLNEDTPIDGPRMVPVACTDAGAEKTDGDPYKGKYNCYKKISFAEEKKNNQGQALKGYTKLKDNAESPATCSKMSVWFFKSAVHDLSATRDLSEEAANVLSPLPMYRMNFMVEYKKAINDAPTRLFFSRLVTEISRH